MYLTIRRYHTDPRNVGEIQRNVQESFVPTLRRIPGFVSYELIDAGAGTIVSVSTFTERAAAEASNRAAADWVRKNLAGFFDGPPDVIAGEAVYRADGDGVERDLAAWG